MRRRCDRTARYKPNSARQREEPLAARMGTCIAEEPQGPNTWDPAPADLQVYASSVTLAFERYQPEAKGAALVGFTRLVQRIN